MQSPIPHPAFRVPFAPSDAALLGAFVAMWGQIDVHLLMCIAKLLDTPVGSANILLDGMTTGPRLNLFAKLAKERLPAGDTQKAAKEFADGMGTLIEKRNHILHGMWGYWVEKDNQKTVPMASHPRYGKFFVAELPEVCARVSEHTHLIVRLFESLYGFSATRDESNPPAFFFGDDQPPPWL